MSILIYLSFLARNFNLYNLQRYLAHRYKIPLEGITFMIKLKTSKNQKNIYLFLKKEPAKLLWLVRLAMYTLTKHISRNFQLLKTSLILYTKFFKFWTQNYAIILFKREEDMLDLAPFLKSNSRLGI